MEQTEPFDLTKAEAAAILGIHVDTLTAWTDKGKLTCLRTIGGHRRYRLSDVEALRDAMVVEATTTNGSSAA